MSSAIDELPLLARSFKLDTGNRLLAYIGLTLFVAYGISTIVLRKNIVDKQGHPIPPGPLLRYAFLRKYSERVIHAWAQAYGGLYSIFLGNQLFMVISDPHVARDLLVTNGAIFSSRKPYFMKNRTILRGLAVTGSAYNDTWLVFLNLLSKLLDHLGIMLLQAQAPKNRDVTSYTQGHGILR